MEKRKVRIAFDKGYTSEELERKEFVTDKYEVMEIPSIREENGVIYYGEDAYYPEMHYAYVPSKYTKDFKDILSWGKYFLISSGGIGRSEDTEMKWICPSYNYSFFIKKPGDIVDFLYFIEETSELRWIRIIGTDDPYQEVPMTRALHYEYEGDGITITGANRFCERMHIPAELNGTPVKKVMLQSHKHSKFLREIVVEEGVEELYMSFKNPYLEIIEIPESVQLTYPPSEIYDTLWFERQPDGPVYFKNWFCGINGTYPEDTLTLKEGTIGIIRCVPLCEQIKKIVFPKSLREIGIQMFGGFENLEEVVLPETEEGQAIQIEGNAEKLLNFSDECSIKGEQLKERLSFNFSLHIND